MAEFRIRLKLTGFELEVEGSREDVPQIAANLGQQFSGLLQPAVSIVEGEVLEPSSTHRSGTPPIAAEMVTPARRGRRGRRPATPLLVGGEPAAGLVAWKHDPDTWGSPQQSWSSTEKAMWFLYVSGQMGLKKEMVGSVIADSFNKMFREAGTIKRGNMPRDLGGLKRRTPALIGEDATKSPTEWYLTEAGVRKAEELVKQARGITSSAA